MKNVQSQIGGYNMKGKKTDKKLFDKIWQETFDNSCKVEHALVKTLSSMVDMYDSQCEKPIVYLGTILFMRNFIKRSMKKHAIPIQYRPQFFISLHCLDELYQEIIDLTSNKELQKIKKDGNEIKGRKADLIIIDDPMGKRGKNVKKPNKGKGRKIKLMELN